MVQWWDAVPRNIAQIQFLNEHAGWAMNGFADLLHTTDGGWHFEPVHTPLAGIDSMFFLNESIGWVAGETENGRAIIATHDGGKTWASYVSPSNDSLFSMQFVDAKYGWAASNENLYRTTDGGITWQPAGSPSDKLSRPFFFLDSHHGWEASDTDIAITSDGGETWVHQKITPRLQSLYFVDPKRGWATAYNQILATGDGGLSWGPPLVTLKEGDNPMAGQYAYFNSLQFLDSNVGFATTADFSVLRTADGGASWEYWQWPDKPKFATSSLLGAISFITPKIGWIGGFALLRTEDGGATFRPINAVPSPAEFGLDRPGVMRAQPYTGSGPMLIPFKNYIIKKMLIANSYTAWAIGTTPTNTEADPEGVLFSTTDGGKTWTQSFIQGNPQDLYLTPDGRGAMYSTDFFNPVQYFYEGRRLRRGP